MLTVYSTLNINSPEVANFHRGLAKEIFEMGGQFWLILRSTFNHLLFLFAKKPYLMSTGFETFLINFAICREIRTLDSQIHLYRMETLIPEVVPSKHRQNLGLEQITYQGAYIRCLSLMIIEGIIKNVLTVINCQTAAEVQGNVQIHQILGVLERSILELFELNKALEKRANAEMPYSQQHREKVRIWQALIVFLQLLEPTIYTKEFRGGRSSVVGYDIVAEIGDRLWDTIKYNHIPTVR